jgi:hypothetical protein
VAAVQPGCTALETVSANLERLIIGNGVIGQVASSIARERPGWSVLSTASVERRPAIRSPARRHLRAQRL